jgi:hypothetical protein
MADAAQGFAAEKVIAEAMGVSLSTVNRAHMAFDQNSIGARLRARWS